MSGGVKLTKAERKLLAEMVEGRMYVLPPLTRLLARRLTRRGLVAYAPETANRFESWRITKAGRSALSPQQGREQGESRSHPESVRDQSLTRGGSAEVGKGDKA